MPIIFLQKYFEVQSEKSVKIMLKCMQFWISEAIYKSPVIPYSLKLTYTCTLTRTWKLDRFYSYLVLTSLSILDRCPVNLNTQAPKLGAFQMGPKTQRGARNSVVGWGTMLQAGRSRVRFSMRSLDFSIDLTLPAPLWPWGRLSL
jgi:hypothetical protein